MSETYTITNFSADIKFEPVDAYMMWIRAGAEDAKSFEALQKSRGVRKVADFLFEIDGKSYEVSLPLLAELLAPYEVKQ